MGSEARRVLGTGGSGRKLSTECADRPQSSMISSSLNDSTKHGLAASLLRQYCRERNALRILYKIQIFKLT